MTEAEVLCLYRNHHAIWSFDYEGDPKAPHAEWTGGLCADGYTNSRLVLCDPRNVRHLAWALAEKIDPIVGGLTPWVIGSANAAITISYELAREIRAMHGVVKKSFIWDELAIPKNAYVLQCEELIATLGTTLKARNAIRVGNPYLVEFHPEILTVMHYPNITEIPRGLKVVSLVTRQVRTWKQSECPLCAAGSPHLRPAQHWDKFVKKG
jgi:hypothetical protein